MNAEIKHWVIIVAGIIITCVIVGELVRGFNVPKPPYWLLAIVWLASAITHEAALVSKMRSPK